MAKTVSRKTWAALWRAFYDHPEAWELRPRDLAPLARAHGVPPPVFRAKVLAERWDLRARRLRATNQIAKTTRYLARSRGIALRELSRTLPLLRSSKTDPRTIRALCFAAYRAGSVLSMFYGLGAWQAEARQELDLASAGKDRPAGPLGGRAWEGRPKMPRVPWY